MSLFYGAVSAEYAPHPAPASGGGLRTKEFAGGRFAYGATVSVHHQDADLCVAWGRPRFLEQGGAQETGAGSPAAAWLTAFNTRGLAAPARVADRFAVVLIRPATRTVILAADRFASYPICYGEDSGDLFFANRADCVPGRWPISAQQLFAYLAFHVVPSPFTIYEGIRSVLPGHIVTWQDGRAESTRYWHPAFDEHAHENLESAKQTFRGLIRDAVAREAADGDVGAFLSGGTDSSTISGMLSEVTSGPPKTYSIGFDVPGYDEMSYARIAARHFKTDHHEYYVGPDDLQAGIEKIVGHFDQPFGNSSAVPTLICAERAKADGVERMLAGDGGDELFGGNVRYAKQRVFGWYHALPGFARSTIVEPIASSSVLGRLPIIRKASSYVQQARIPLPDRMHTYNLLLRLGLERVLEPDFLAAVDADGPFEQQRSWWASVGCRSEIDRMLAFDWKHTLTDSDLPKVVGATECARVDVAFPFLAQELVDFSLTLPPEWKVKRLTLRWFFKEALRNFLPVEVLTKQKHGFGLPFGTWACSHVGLKRLVAETLTGLEQRRIVRPAFIRQLLHRDLPDYPGYFGEMVWVLMMLELWLVDHSPDFRVAG